MVMENRTRGISRVRRKHHVKVGKRHQKREAMLGSGAEGRERVGTVGNGRGQGAETLRRKGLVKSHFLARRALLATILQTTRVVVHSPREPSVSWKHVH